MGLRILIADDHVIFRSGLRALLEKESDLEVVAEAGSGAETLELVEQARPDVLVLDINMPQGGGSQTAQAILSQWPDLVIVVLTMHDDEYYLQEMLKLDVRGYVLKKSTGTEVVQAIRAAHRGDIYVDPALAGYMVSPYVGKPVAPRNDQLGQLTPREREVCRHLALGHTNAEVAKHLFLSARTVETHRKNIFRKLNLDSRAELVRFSIETGLLRIQEER